MVVIVLFRGNEGSCVEAGDFVVKGAINKLVHVYSKPRIFTHGVGTDIVTFVKQRILSLDLVLIFGLKVTKGKTIVSINCKNQKLSWYK